MYYTILVSKIKIIIFIKSYIKFLYLHILLKILALLITYQNILENDN
jgi:hypothetical protein